MDEQANEKIRAAKAVFSRSGGMAGNVKQGRIQHYACAAQALAPAKRYFLYLSVALGQRRTGDPLRLDSVGAGLELMFPGAITQCKQCKRCQIHSCSS